MAPKAFTPSSKLAVTRFVLKPDQVNAFIAAQSKITRALAAAGYHGPLRWFELVSGGESPQFLRLSDRDNWAAYGQSPDEELDGILEKMYGKEQGASILQEADGAVRSKYVETWQYRPDLSFVAKTN